MSILVVVEHDNQAVNAATLNTLAAARQIGGDIHLLVAGANCAEAANAAAALEGADKVYAPIVQNMAIACRKSAPLVAGMAAITAIFWPGNNLW